MEKVLKTGLLLAIIAVLAMIIYQKSDIVWNGDFNLDFGQEQMKPFFELEEEPYFAEGQEIQEQVTTLQESFAGEITGIEVKSTGVSIVFTQSTDEKEIQAEVQKVGQCQLFEKDGILTIIVNGAEKKEMGEGKVTLSIPEDYAYRDALEVSVKSSACEVSFQKLQAHSVRLEASAGTIKWEELVSDSLELELAAGSITGAHTTIIQTAFMKISAGEVKITLSDTYEDYNYAVSCAGGSVTIGEQTAQGIAKKAELYNQAFRNVDIECSVGSVKIDFAATPETAK